MASSSQTNIDHPDFSSGAPHGAALNVCSGTLGVSVRNPGGQALTWTAKDFSGDGPVLGEQGGNAFAVNAVSRVPILALQLPGQSYAGLAAGTVIPAPDLSVGDGDGTATFLRVATAVNGLDWIGGMGTPRLPGGAQPFGTVRRMMNISNGGQTINIIDASSGGSVRVGAPSVLWGFLEIVDFSFDSFGWQLVSRAGSYQFNGGFGNGGGRRITTASVATKRLYFAPKGNTWTQGTAFIGDVTVGLAGGGPASIAWTWLNVRAGWDSSNAFIFSNTLFGPKVSDSFGNAAAVAAGFTGSELSIADDATYHGLYVTPPTAAPLVWTYQNVRHACPPF